MSLPAYLKNIFWCGFILISLSCKKPSNEGSSEDSGYVSGTVTDTQGNPLSGVKILIDNTLLYNTNIQSSTDANGKYRVKLTTGSWMAYAILNKNYNGKTYSLYLDSQTPQGFGIEGGIRNFQWKLTGNKKDPLTGTYGGTILLTRGVGSTLFDSENIEFTLTPVGNLIDGSTGQVLKVREDATYPRLADIPIGRYRITAEYKSSSWNFPVKLMDHYNQAGGFVDSIVIDFDPNSLDGPNMASIEYHE